VSSILLCTGVFSLAEETVPWRWSLRLCDMYILRSFSVVSSFRLLLIF